jgi:hypothetical protein
MSKIDKQHLEKIGFKQLCDNSHEFIYNYDYLFNTITNELYFINDGYGEPELIVNKIKDIKHLQQVIYLMH